MTSPHITFPSPYEFGEVMVFESGIPNKERVVFRPTETTELARYGLWLAVQNLNGTVTPLIDRYFWFGVSTITPPCWIVVFTGKGTPTVVEHAVTKVPVHCFHWGSKHTLFNAPNIIPVLHRIDAISIGVHMTPPSSLPDAKANPVQNNPRGELPR